jgi:hypothetical protein
MDFDRARFHHCGSQNHSGAGWYHVRAHGLACAPAREVARTFWNTGGDRHFNGWTCHSHQLGEESSALAARGQSTAASR